MRQIRNLFGDPIAFLAPILALFLALLVGAFILLALGKNPIEAYGVLFDGAIGSDSGRFRSLTRATPLLLVAIGTCIAFRGGVINIGAEGQLFLGSVSATAFALAASSFLPMPLLIIGTLVTGFLGGAFWGAIPGYLKAKFSVNEILSTVMMNEISVQLLIFLLSGPMIDPEQVKAGTRISQSARLPESSWLPFLTEEFRLHAGIIVAIVMAIVIYILLSRTTIGYRIRAVGLNRDASRYAGIPVPTYLTLALVLSGGLAGLAGAVEVTGVTHRMVEGFAVGYGFSGIVVALFGRLHPLGAIPASILFGALLVGAEKMQRSIQVPSATITVLQGLVVIFVVSSELWIRRRNQVRLEKSYQPNLVTPEKVAS